MRHMSYAKFADALYRKALFFAPVTSLSDKFEGTLPHPYSETGLASHIDYGDDADDARPSAEKALRTSREIMRHCSMINSWCLSEHESISMWDRYAPTDGLSILTDVKSLKAAFSGSHSVLIGEVHYIDYDRDMFQLGLGRPFNAFIPLLHKRREYVDEREVRAIVADHIEKPNTSKLRHQPVDLAVLIKEIIVSPEAGDWLIALVSHDLERNGINALVSRAAGSWAQRSRNVMVMPAGPTPRSSARAQTRTGRAGPSGPGPLGRKNGG